MLAFVEEGAYTNRHLTFGYMPATVKLYVKSSAIAIRQGCVVSCKSLTVSLAKDHTGVFSRVMYSILPYKD